MNWGFGAFTEDDERVLRVFRRPLLFTFPWVIIRGALWSVVVGAIWFFYPAYDQLDISYVWQGLALVGFLHTSGPLFMWYFNALVMTNESLIIVDWPKLWERRSTRIDFHNLDEITVERVGIRSFLLNYGNLMLAKVNGGDQHLVRYLSRPTRAARIMEDYREWFLDQRNFTEESALKGLLSGMVQRHVGAAGQPSRERRGERYDTTYEPPENRVESHTTERFIERIPDDRVRTSESPDSSHRKPFKKKNFDDLAEVEVELELGDEGGPDIDLEDRD